MLSRFVSKKSDVIVPFEVKKGIANISLTLSYVDYNKEYDRGTLPGIDAIAVREILNTTGRYGVVDKNIAGGNGWRTNWKCLHEPFFAQIGMAVNDKNYTQNFASTLDQERDLAIEPDGTNTITIVLKDNKPKSGVNTFLLHRIYLEKV